MSIVMGIYVKFYYDHPLNMVLSRDPKAANFENFYFSSDSILNFRKSYQIWGNWLKNKKVTGKNPLLTGLSFLHHT